MHSENVEGVVGFHVVLQFGRIIAAEGSHNAENGRRPHRDVAGSWGNGHEASDGARAEADGGPFVIQAVVEYHPGETTYGSGEMGNDTGHDGTQVSAERGTAVEAKPADPEEDGADDDVGDVVGPVGETVEIAVPAAFAEHDRVCKSRCPRRDVNRCATREVEAAHFVDPPSRVPGPASDGVVNESSPNEHKDHAREHTATISRCAYC